MSDESTQIISQLRNQQERLRQRIKNLQQSPWSFLKCWVWMFPKKLANIAMPTVAKYGMVCCQCKHRLPRVTDFPQTHMCCTTCDARGVFIKDIDISWKKAGQKTYSECDKCSGQWSKLYMLFICSECTGSGAVKKPKKGWF